MGTEKKWICQTNFLMDTKEIAFRKNKVYEQVGEIENGIELINEQGHAHLISGECLELFQVITDENFQNQNNNQKKISK